GAKQHIFDPAHHGDVETDALLEHPDVPGMHAQRLAWPEFVGDDLTVQLDPRLAFAGDPLQDEALATKNASAKRSLETHRQFDLWRRAQEAVSMDHVRAPESNVDRQNMAWDFSREGDKT